jgi:hypothetical protein
LALFHVHHAAGVLRRLQGDRFGCREKRGFTGDRCVPQRFPLVQRCGCRW